MRQSLLLLSALLFVSPVFGVTLTFMHHADMHANLTTHAELVPDGAVGEAGTATKVVQRGGIARLATLVKQIRAQNPNSVLMSIGDTYHGGVEAMYTVGNAIVEPMNSLGVDVGVPGNWDFGWGPFVFRARYTDASRRELEALRDPLRPQGIDQIFRPNYPNLAANMTETLSGRHLLPPTLTKVVGGVKVGFIGITSDIVKFTYPLLAPGLTFTQGEDQYTSLINRYAAQLRAEGSAVVVVMSELGLAKNWRLAERIKPGSVDVIFSAHTHELTSVPLTSASGALVVETGNDTNLGRMDIKVANNKVLERSWRVIPIDTSIPEDPTTKAIVDRHRERFLRGPVNINSPLPNITMALTHPIDMVIGHTKEPLDRKNALENHFNNALTDILRYYGKTQIAVTPGFRFSGVIAEPGVPLEGNVVASGDITLEDVYRFLPMPFLIATAEITGAQLRMMIEESLKSVYSREPFSQIGGWTFGFSGLRASVDLSAADSNRVLDLRLTDTGASISDNTVITVTGCRRPIEPRDKLCNFRGVANLQPLIRTGTFEPWTGIDILIEGLTRGVPYSAARRDITDVSGIPLWPQSTWKQPLPGLE